MTLSFTFLISTTSSTLIPSCPSTAENPQLPRKSESENTSPKNWWKMEPPFSSVREYFREYVSAEAGLMLMRQIDVFSNGTDVN